MTDLSPAAQVVLDAYQSAHPVMHPADKRAVAAALRAAAIYCTREKRILLTIADELEAWGYKQALAHINTIASELKTQ
jgi:hypothetical protein